MTTVKEGSKDFWIPLLSTIVALAGILSAFLTQFYTTQTTVELKKYEVTFRVKQETYAKFMILLSDAFYLAWKSESFGSPELEESSHKLTSTYLSLEPFIDQKETREEMWHKFGKLRVFYEKVALKKVTGDPSEIKFFEYQKYFRKRLLKELFRDKK